MTNASPPSGARSMYKAGSISSSSMILKRSLAIWNDIDARVSWHHGRCSERLFGERNPCRAVACKAAQLRQMWLHPEVACLRPLHDGVTELTFEENQRKFARSSDLFDQWLEDHRPTATLGEKTIVRPDEVRSRRTCRNRRLYHQPLTSEAASGLVEIRIAAALDGEASERSQRRLRRARRDRLCRYST